MTEGREREIYFATCAQYPNLTGDDWLTLAPLAARGIGVRPLVWDSEAARDLRGGTIVIRSCWDYHHRAEEFLAWIRALRARGATFWNPPEVVAWNANKLYLRDLAARGVRVPETRWFPRGATARLAEALREAGWREAVVKPLISATAHRTWITSPDTAPDEEAAFADLLAGTGAMLQRFVPEVASAGEWSLIFFNGVFSHAALKRPKPGDFRVQEDHGGMSLPAEAPPRLIERAARILRLVEEPLLYARVDGIEANGEFHLMELELIEPLLFLALDPHAPERFAEAILAGALTAPPG